MKSIIFFRHAKSDWDADYSEDHNRPLSKRGYKSARAMGQLLNSWNQVPDSIICSTATRAHDTLQLASKEGNWGTIPTRVTSRLYLCGPSDVLKEIHREPNTSTRLMLVGHEPTWSEMVGMLVGSADVRFPTAAMARIDFDTDQWNYISPGGGQLIWLLPPKMII